MHSKDMKKMVVEECSLKQLFFFRILEMLDHEKREWKVDVNIGFWKCWAIFRADILKFSKRNDMSVFDGSSRQLFTLSFDDHSPHLEDYLWLKNWKEKSSSPTLFSIGNLGSNSEIGFVAKCVNSLQIWSFDRISIERLHKISRHPFYPFSQCLKITQNVVFLTFNFGFFYQFLSY